MAARRGRSGGGGGGGIKAGITSGLMLLILAGFVFGWAQANNIKGVDGVLEYFRTWSKEVEDCGVGNLEWNCSTPIPGYEKNNQSSTPNFTKPEIDLSIEETLGKLANIATKPAQKVDYKRSEWKHWSDLDGNGCNTRQDTLILSGSDVTVDPKKCKVTSGTWLDPYSGEVFTDASKLDIDHIVPLSYASANGGQALNAEQKQAFANDALNLSISAAAENRSKGDKGPSEYLPPNTKFLCEYVKSFTAVVSKYELTMPEADASKIAETVKKHC